MKKYIYIIVFTFAMAINIGCSMASVKPSKVLFAPILNDDAFNEELLIPIGEDSIAGYALIAKGENPKETVILIKGYPGNDTNFDIGQKIRQSGKNVILFNHRGAWGSQGVYSYSNCLADIQEVIRYLSQDEVSSRLRIKKDAYTLIGRSLGGGVALITGSQIPSVKNIIAISSVNYGSIMTKYTSINQLGSYKKYMQRQIMMNHDIDSFLQELLDNKKEYNIVKYAEELGTKSVLFIEDSNQNKDWILQVPNAKYVVMDSDHNFVNEREELSSTILNWLNMQ